MISPRTAGTAIGPGIGILWGIEILCRELACNIYAMEFPMVRAWHQPYWPVSGNRHASGEGPPRCRLSAVGCGRHGSGDEVVTGVPGDRRAPPRSIEGRLGPVGIIASRLEVA